jgi:hypothetical protein
MSKTLQWLLLVLGVCLVVLTITSIINSGSFISNISALFSSLGIDPSTLIAIAISIVVLALIFVALFFVNDYLKEEGNLQKIQPIFNNMSNPEVSQQPKPITPRPKNELIVVDDQRTVSLGVWSGFKFGFGFAIGAFVAGVLLFLIFGALLVQAISVWVSEMAGGF